ncbi:MAG: terminase [Bacteroidales bacterium]|nr:terminase [Bacteroidales bacterium]
MATRKELESKKEFARLYYMQGETQKSISVKIGISESTISKWVEKGGWEAKRAGTNITRPEIVNKNLVLISKLLDKLNDEAIDLKDVGKIVDQISKLAAAIERIDKKANVIDAIEVFTALSAWMEKRMQWDDKITPELLSQFSYYQDLYVSEQIKK